MVNESKEENEVFKFIKESTGERPHSISEKTIYEQLSSKLKKTKLMKS